MPRTPTSKRVLTTIALVMLILQGSSAPTLMRIKRDPTPAGAKKMQVKIAWRTRARDLVHLGFAPNGRFACTVTSAGKLSVFTSAGKRCYTATVPGANRAVISPDGKYALAYANLDPVHYDLVFLDSQGKPVWKTGAASAVWSADACVTERGGRFVVGTGTRCVYVFDVSKTARRYRWWRTHGAVVSINLLQNGENVLYGTWQDSRITRADISGNIIWERELDSASRHYLEMLNASDRMLLRCVPNRRGADGEFHVTDASGQTLWQGEVSASAKTRVVCSPNGRYVCLGNVTLIQHKGKSVSERRAVLYDASGERLWEQGSMFLQVQPIFVSSTGEALLANTKGALFVVHRDGSLEASAKLPGSVVRWAQARDGSAMLVQCSDGSICKLSIIQ